MIHGKRKRRIVQLSDGRTIRTLTTRSRFERRYPKRHYDRKTKTYRILSSLAERAWRDLISDQKAERVQALLAKRLIQRKTPLEFAAREVGLTVEQLRDHLGDNLFRKGTEWIAKPHDNIERGLQIIKDGRYQTIIVGNDVDASLIGLYHNAVKKAIHDKDERHMLPFKNVVITDVDGHKHTFETNIKELDRIKSRVEQPEFQELYDLESWEHG